MNCVNTFRNLLGVFWQEFYLFDIQRFIKCLEFGLGKVEVWAKESRSLVRVNSGFSVSFLQEWRKDGSSCKVICSSAA